MLEVWGGRNPAVCAGVDEVGRGSLFGPVFAAAVILPPQALPILQKAGLTDSKRLSARARAALIPLLRRQALSWALGQASAAEIDRHGIRSATEAAMTRALQRLSITPELVLIDGVLPLRGWSGPQRTVIK
ncbi:MAG: ribonuclease HII, partial [Cyanobacteriota bacterium]